MEKPWTRRLWLGGFYLPLRHIDTAAVYGTETGIGQGLAEAFRRGLVKREDVFVTTKALLTDYEPEDLRIALNKSLANLQLDYVDLYLLHWPLKLRKGASFPLKAEDFAPDNDLLPTWRALESFQREGLVKSIGVSNFSVKNLDTLLPHVSIVPAVNQVELPLLAAEEAEGVLRQKGDSPHCLFPSWCTRKVVRKVRTRQPCG